MISKNELQPLISVIMSVYDEPIEEINKSIQSILDQTYKNIEYVICLDNPLNERAAVFLRDLTETDSRIIFLENTQNIGLGFSLNKCLSACNGEYVARMDSDDISYPDRLARQLEFLKGQNSEALCFTEVEMVDSEGNVVPRRFPEHATFKKSFFKDDAFVHATLMMRRDVYLRFQYQISHSPEDYEMYFRMKKEGVAFHLLNERLYQYNFNSKVAWRSLEDRCLRTRKTARIMLPLLSRNMWHLWRCRGYFSSLFKYVCMAILASNNRLYRLSTFLYSPFRSK